MKIQSLFDSDQNITGFMHPQSIFVISCPLCCFSATCCRGITVANAVYLDVQSHAYTYSVWINYVYTYLYHVASSDPINDFKKTEGNACRDSRPRPSSRRHVIRCRLTGRRFAVCKDAEPFWCSTSRCETSPVSPT